MTVFTHGVGVEDVLDRLPLAKGSVTETSQGLTTTMLESWMVTAAGILNALMERMAIDPLTLGPNETQLVREGIVCFVEARALAAREYPEDRVARAHRQWDDVRRTVRDFPGDLGKSKSASSTVVSTASSGPSKPKRWGDGFKGF